MSKTELANIFGLTPDHIPDMFWLCTLLFGIVMLWAVGSHSGLLRGVFRSKKPELSSHDSLPTEIKIEPLVNFEWSTTEPRVVRPFKPQYHMTMGT